MDGTRISVIPSDDLDFSEQVRDRSGRVQTPEELEELLRPDYPRVRVVRGVTDILERWYVYREGHWIPS